MNILYIHPEMLLNNALVAGLLAAAAYKAFEVNLTPYIPIYTIIEFYICVYVTFRYKQYLRRIVWNRGFLSRFAS